MQYYDVDEIFAFHEEILRIEGGRAWVHNLGQVDALLNFIKDDVYYPTIARKAAHLLFGLVQFHCFTDANKRTAVASTFMFLRANDHDLSDVGIGILRTLALLIAKGKITEEDAHELLKDYIGE